MAWTSRTPVGGNASTGSTFTISFPSGYTTGDYALLCVTWEAARSITTPGDWTLIQSQTGTNGKFAVYYNANRGASNPTSVWSLDASLVSWLEWHVRAGTGQDTGAGFINASAFAAISNASDPDPPSATATVAGTLVHSFGSNWDNGGNTFTTNTGYSNFFTNGQFFDLASSEKTLVSAGAEDPGAFPNGGGATVNGTFAATVILAPAGSGSAAGNLAWIRA